MNRSEIKQMAKKKMSGNWETGLLVLVLFHVVLTVVSIFTLGVGAVVVVGPLNLGVMIVYNSFLTNEASDWKKMFSPFKDRLPDSFIVGGIDEVLDLLPKAIAIISSPAMFATAAVAGVTGGILAGLAAVLVGVAVIIVVVVISYMYDEGLYILIREPETKGIAALKKSRQIMNGNKMPLFIFDLSFIGWLLLVVVTAGIALIYVKPYYECARLIMLEQIYNKSVGEETKYDAVEKETNVEVEVKEEKKTKATSKKSKDKNKKDDKANQAEGNFCRFCGAELPEGAVFCGKCGKAQEDR